MRRKEWESTREKGNGNRKRREIKTEKKEIMGKREV